MSQSSDTDSGGDFPVTTQNVSDLFASRHEPNIEQDEECCARRAKAAIDALQQIDMEIVSRVGCHLLISYTYIYFG
jgi:hypothetical protein